MSVRRFAAGRELASAVSTIMVKELRARMRGRRAFIVLTVYLALLAAITYAVYLMSYSGARAEAAMAGQFGGTAVNASARIGQWIFFALSFLQLLLVCFIAPAFTAGAISLEREKQTLDLLVSTPLRPAGIVIGKLLAALAFVVLVVFASIPLSAIVLMYGGASIDDILRQQVVLLVAALGFGTVGLFFSALVKRTQMATVLTYSAVLLLTLGTTFLYGFWTAMVMGGGQFNRRAPEAIVYLNPFIGMADVVAYTEDPNSGGLRTMLREMRGGAGGGFDATIDPVPAGAFPTECRMLPDGSQVCEEMPIAVPACPPNADCAAVGVREPVLAVPQAVAADPGYFWPRFTIGFGLLAVVLTLASTRLVVPAGMRFAFRRRAGPTAAAAAPRPAAAEQTPDTEAVP
jgi:ABC-2 type transport system permease protein